MPSPSHAAAPSWQPVARFRRYFESRSFYLVLAGLAATCVLVGVAVHLVMTHSSSPSDSGGPDGDATYFPMCRDADPTSQRRGGPPSPIQVPEGKLLVLWLSDVHLNPKYDLNARAGGPGGEKCLCETTAGHCSADSPAFDGRLGCDPPISLLHQALRALRNITSDPHLVIVTGCATAQVAP